MSNLYCDHCGSAAIGFALRPPSKVKVCQEHSTSLISKKESVLSIDAFQLVESAEDYPEYIRRSDIAQKCQRSIITLQERCEHNRSEAHSRLQTAQEAMQTVLDRSFQEMHIRVEQYYQQVKEELASLCVQLETFMSDKGCVLSPALSAMQSTPVGALFKVGVADNSLELAKAVLESCVLLPLDGGMPQADTGEKLLKKARDMMEQADLAEVLCAYASELGCAVPNLDLTAAINKKRWKVAKGMLLTLSWTATEQQLRGVAEQYLQAGAGAREAGDSQRAVTKLEKGWGLLQLWGVESAEVSLELGLALAHCGRREEACTMLRRGLQHRSSLEVSWKLSRSLVEVLFQTGKWKETSETAELLLTSAESCQNTFELLQIIYFVTKSYYNLGNRERGFELVSHWTSRLVVESVNSQSVLQFISAEKKYEEGNKEEAAKLYEEGLNSLESSYTSTYIAVVARYNLGFFYQALNLQEKALTHYSKAATTFSTHFPHTIHYANYLACLGDLSKSMKNDSAAEGHYLRANAIYSAHFPLDINYGHCLFNVGILLKNRRLKREATERFKAALPIYLHNNFQDMIARSQALIQELSN